MNAYYSNLIEGHNTRPADIEAAMAGRDTDPEKRPLIQEALAHIAVQDWIDTLADHGDLPEPTSTELILDIHRRFYDAMPAELRFAEHRGQRIEIVPAPCVRPARRLLSGSTFPRRPTACPTSWPISRSGIMD